MKQNYRHSNERVQASNAQKQDFRAQLHKRVAF
jgi:hypothetical protein